MERKRKKAKTYVCDGWVADMSVMNSVWIGLARSVMDLRKGKMGLLRQLCEVV